MIVRIQGQLEIVIDNTALVTLDQLTYEVLLTSYAAGRLGGSIGQEIMLHTFHYFEAQGQGSHMLPRLAGFLDPVDREFFELFITCKGIGYRKALRAMAVHTGQLAAAIADRDVALLQSLPEIGRRTAETIVAALHGKVDAFLHAAPVSTDNAGKPRGSTASAGTADGAPVASSMRRETLAVLTQLGENRAQAIAWIDQALRDPDDPPADAQDLLNRVFRIRDSS